jgi:DNA-binding transcriptional MerR regulator
MENYIPISEMAKLHGITRQTLIHYDSIGLFTPVKVNEKGYRFYSRYQIPYLREICFLKNMGIELQDIVNHFQNRSPAKEIELLQKQKKIIMAQIAELNKRNVYLKQRIDIYEEAENCVKMHMHEPFIKSFLMRQAIVTEHKQPVHIKNFHVTFASLRDSFFEKGIEPSNGYGSLIKIRAVLSRDWTRGAECFIFLPQWHGDLDNLVRFPVGEYACLYKYGLPYDGSYIEKLLTWIEKNNYKLCGDIIDVRLSNNSFFARDNSADLRMLQALVQKRK